MYRKRQTLKAGPTMLPTLSKTRRCKKVSAAVVYCDGYQANIDPCLVLTVTHFLMSLS